MIFNSIKYANDNYVNEAELEEILESAPNRFEHETIAEATARVIGEQEVNWGRLMVGVGLGELHGLQEHGMEFINEEGRIKGFFNKVIAFFKMAINKLAEITKAFIAKLDSLIRSNDAFIKKYKSTLSSAKDSVYKDLKFTGYKAFNHSVLDTKPTYDTEQKIDLSWKEATEIAILKEDDYTPAKAKLKLVPGYKEDDNFNDAVTKYLFGSDEKEEFDITKEIVTKSVDVISKTKDLKKKAKESYTQAAKKIKEIIKNLEKAESDVENKKNRFSDNELTKTTNAQDRARDNFGKGYRILIEYWKSYSEGCKIYHGTLMRALSTRNKQSKAICVKVIQKALKQDGQKKRNDYRSDAGMDKKTYSEGYIDSDAFLGAVEFI